MPDAVETMAYNQVEVPWHGLGNAVDANLTPAEMATAAGLDWQVEKSPMFIQGPSGLIEVAEKALVRSSDHSVLGVVGSKYVPTQNASVMEFFKRFTEAGHMTMETAGSLRGGRFIWALARINRQFNIGDDENRSYVLLCNPHLPGYALTADFTSIRVVCWNTLSMALESLSNKAFRMAHFRSFEGDVHAEAEMALGIATQASTTFEEQARELASKQIDTEKLNAFLRAVFKPTPAVESELQAEVEEAEGIAAEPESTPQVEPEVAAAGATPRARRQITPRLVKQSIAAFENGPGSNLPSAHGTWWGALNAVTYVLDHEVGRSADSRLQQAWFGERAKTKRAALDLALAGARD